jgi:hypothetical protein
LRGDGVKVIEMLRVDGVKMHDFFLFWAGRQHWFLSPKSRDKACLVPTTRSRRASSGTQGFYLDDFLTNLFTNSTSVSTPFILSLMVGITL